MTRCIRVLLLFAGLVVTACGPPISPPPQRPNIVLISVDSLRADHLGSYGYARSTSPTIDRLAQGGVLFEDVSSSSSWTLPAHAALFTALPDSIHRVDRGERKLEPWHRTLAEALADAGYRTAGIWSGPLLDPRFGFGQGFDDYVGLHWGSETADAASDSSPWERSVKRSHEVVTGPKVLDRVKSLLGSSSDEHADETAEETAQSEAPLFLFIHLWDVHYDYIPPSPYDALFTDSAYDGDLDGRELTRLLTLDKDQLTPADLQQLIALYDGEIAWVDHQIDQIMELLDSRLGGETLVVITSDHGEEFFEHGKFGHKRALYEESIRIPLVLHAPGRLPAGRRIQDPVRMVDIAPTLIELAAGEPLPDVLGRSLMPLIEGRSLPKSPVISELVSGSSQLLAARQDGLKIIAFPESGAIQSTYDLADDPAETSNLVDADGDGEAPEDATRVLRQALAEIRHLEQLHENSGATAPLDDDLRRELESLGYVGSSANDSFDGLRARPNPIRVCDGGDLGITHMEWRVRDGEGIYLVRVGSETGKIFAQGTSFGSAKTGLWVRDGMLFVLTEQATGAVVARTRVGVSAAGCE